MDLSNTALLHWMVGKAYERLESFTKVTEEPLRLTLSEMQTHRPESFDELPSSEVFTLVSEPGIATARATQTWSDGAERGKDGLWYEAHWRAPEDGPVVSAMERDLFEPMTFGELVRYWGSREAALYSVEAVTTYRVTARLDGRQRTYRAAFVWIPSDDGETTSLMVLDNVTQGVEAALRETDQPMRRGADSDRKLGGTGLPEASRHGSSSWRPEHLEEPIDSCWSHFRQEVSEQTASAGTGHLDGGSHRATGLFAIECSCDSTCSSRCQSVVQTKVCSDTTGFSLTGYDGLVTCHQMSHPSIDNELIISGDGHVVGARCGAAVACAMRACTFGCGVGCSASISVAVSGGNVSLSNISGDWSQVVKMVKTCRTCDLQPEIEQDHDCPRPGDGPPIETGTAGRAVGL